MVKLLINEPFDPLMVPYRTDMMHEQCKKCLIWFHIFGPRRIGVFKTRCQHWYCEHCITLYAMESNRCPLDKTSYSEIGMYQMHEDEETCGVVVWKLVEILTVKRLRGITHQRKAPHWTLKIEL